MKELQTKSDNMKNIQKLIIVLSLVIFLNNVFAEDTNTDWIAFPKENIKTYPIIFGNIKEPDGIQIVCEDNFSPSVFKPSQEDLEIGLTSSCDKNQENQDVFFYIGNLNQNKFQSLTAKDIFRFYFIETNLKINPDQNLSLTFPFKLS